MDEECERASHYEQAAANDQAGTLAIYNATVSGLAANASCADATLRIVNEAYLRSLRAPAEAQLRIGDWKADLNLGDEYLRRCVAMPALRGTKAAADCRMQLSINRTMRARLSALISPTAR
ncbi:MAG: hypothetical protein JO036_14365 [Candidatus Eremiobacteraeota bacterium]|nr:hypothetical protein [Candidatus Eremiobacteraeota bacterium]